MSYHLDVRWWPTVLVLIACEPPPPPRYAEPPVFADYAEPQPASPPVQADVAPDDPADPVPADADDPSTSGQLPRLHHGNHSAATTAPTQAATKATKPSGPVMVARSTEVAFDGGSIELQLMRDGDRIEQLAINHYMVPVVIHWQLAKLVNLDADAATDGVAILPAAPAPMGDAQPVVLADLAIHDVHAVYKRTISLTARFGDPRARPRPYSYRLPYPSGKTFSVLQGFHGAFSHRGSDEYAVDFDCPVATPVMAARDGIVVATHASAQGAGQTPDYLDYKKTNFVLVLHDDGTLGEYMHLAPAGVEVMPGQKVKRGEELALSGHTGYSSTPHLHFQVMTAATDGVMAHSFPFGFALNDRDTEEPVEGKSYPSWE